MKYANGSRPQNYKCDVKKKLIKALQTCGPTKALETRGPKQTGLGSDPWYRYPQGEIRYCTLCCGRIC